MATNWELARTIPDEQTRADFFDYFGRVIQKAHATTWGLTDQEKALAGLLRFAADSKNRLDEESDEGISEVVGLENMLGEAQMELEALRQAHREAEGQVSTLRMQLGRAKKKIDKLEGSIDG